MSDEKNPNEQIREALVQIVTKAKILRGKHMFFGEEREAFDGIIKIAEEALKIPLRNCDIGSFMEQQDRFDDLCGDSGGCANCPVGPTDWATTCEIKWANMPYIEKKEN